MGSSILPSLISIHGPRLRQPVSKCRGRSSNVFYSDSSIQLVGTFQAKWQPRLRLPLVPRQMRTVVAGVWRDGERSSQKVSQRECEDIGEVERAGGGQLDSGNPIASSSSPITLFSVAPLIVYGLIAEDPGYSQASYYTSLGLFVISVPGIWSLVKRSIKSKIVKKTFAMPSPKVSEVGKLPSQIAGEITASLVRNNFNIADRGETVTFEGIMLPSRGQAAFLSFCTAVSLGCVGLVLSITLPDVGGNWYYLTLLSPLAGFYYWTRASRKEQIKVKMVQSDDESSTDVIIQGDDEQIDRLRRELGLMEKGMVYVKGILER